MNVLAEKQNVTNLSAQLRAWIIFTSSICRRN